HTHPEFLCRKRPEASVSSTALLWGESLSQIPGNRRALWYPSPVLPPRRPDTWEVPPEHGPGSLDPIQGGRRHESAPSHSSRQPSALHKQNGISLSRQV